MDEYLKFIGPDLDVSIVRAFNCCDVTSVIISNILVSCCQFFTQSLSKNTNVAAMQILKLKFEIELNLKIVYYWEQHYRVSPFRL